MFEVMTHKRSFNPVRLLAFAAVMFVATFAATAGEATNTAAFPPALSSYGDANISGLWDVLKHRAQAAPFNIWATVLFLCAVIHTFLTHKFRHWAHVLGDRAVGAPVGARVLHFLGEVEAVFGIWVLPLFALMIFQVGWAPALEYVNSKVSYHEPLFVVVIMTIASTKPILHLAEQCLQLVARIGRCRPAAWWLTILSLGPVLGSLITEPAAMTISALLLAQQFYELKPSPRFAYATLGLLFVNVSVGGVLTHFAAPPVLMVAKPWGWGTPHMFTHFGLEALLGIAVSNTIYFLIFRREFAKLKPASAAHDKSLKRIPAWVTAGHLLFMAWSVFNAHHPALLIGGFLFFLAFHEVAADWQGELQLRSPILVGFFLAGLVIHGGLQSWWIEPVLSRLGEVPLMLGATVLTAFNDNAAITYLATLVPSLTPGMKYAVVAGAVTGGGLTVIANAPNPAGQSILAKYFPDGISALGLFLGALIPTGVMALVFLLLR